jgi:hypothetical protein
MTLYNYNILTVISELTDARDALRGMISSEGAVLGQEATGWREVPDTSVQDVDRWMQVERHLESIQATLRAALEKGKHLPPIDGVRTALRSIDSIADHMEPDPAHRMADARKTLRMVSGYLGRVRSTVESAMVVAKMERQAG